MDPGGPILLALSLVALAFFGLGARRSWQRRHVLTSTPEVELSSLRPGFYRSRGRIVSASESFETPLSEKACVYYELEAEERRGSGRNRYWHTIVHDEKSSRVEIEDASGRAAIDLPNADLRFILDRHISTGLLSSAPAIVERRLMEKYGETTKGRLFNKKMRLRETFLELGDEIHVIGRVAWTDESTRFESGGPAFIVTDHEFEHLVARESRIFLVWVAAGLVVVGLSAMIGVAMLG